MCNKAGIPITIDELSASTLEILAKSVHEQWMAILVRFVPPISEWFVPLISVQTVPPDN